MKSLPSKIHVHFDMLPLNDWDRDQCRRTGNLQTNGNPLNLVGVRARGRVQRTSQIYLNTTDRYKYNDNAHVLDAP